MASLFSFFSCQIAVYFVLVTIPGRCSRRYKYFFNIALFSSFILKVIQVVKSTLTGE